MDRILSPFGYGIGNVECGKEKYMTRGWARGQELLTEHTRRRRRLSMTITISAVLNLHILFNPTSQNQSRTLCLSIMPQYYTLIESKEKTRESL